MGSSEQCGQSRSTHSKFVLKSRRRIGAQRLTESDRMGRGLGIGFSPSRTVAARSKEDDSATKPGAAWGCVWRHAQYDLEGSRILAWIEVFWASEPLGSWWVWCFDVHFCSCNILTLHKVFDALATFNLSEFEKCRSTKQFDRPERVYDFWLLRRKSWFLDSCPQNAWMKPILPILRYSAIIPWKHPVLACDVLICIDSAMDFITILNKEYKTTTIS